MLEPHAASWDEEFAALRRVYAAALGDFALEIEHVGSTAVTDLLAKPIIDIDVVIQSYEDFPQVIAALRALGYEHRGDQGIAQREAFRRASDDVPRVAPARTWMRHHLYVCPAGSPELRRHLAFRDALRSRLELRCAYEAMKRNIAARVDGDRTRYARIKDFECRRFILDAIGEPETPVALEPCATHVSRSARHEFHKTGARSIRLVAGIGVDGDAHAGVTVQHRSRVAVDPSQPNLRQVHLMHAELFAELAGRGYKVAAGELGENITTRGLDLLALPTGARLQLGAQAVIEVTGLRNPCGQIDAWQPGLLAAVVDHAADGSLIRKTGIMGVVVQGGEVRPGDPITVVMPPPPHRKLERV